MTFPTIPAVADGRALVAVQANTTATRTFPNLSGLTAPAGDLLLAIVVAYQSASPAGANAAFSGWTAGWTEFVDQMTTPGTTMAIGAAWKYSSGSETGQPTVTQAATITGHAALILLAIPGAHASTPPTATAIANGTSAGADPAALDPAGWAAEDTLWIAVGASGETSLTGSYLGITAAPANYTGDIQTGISADAIGGVEGAVSFRQLNAASEDVGAWTADFSNARNSALLIAVRPAPGVTNIALGQPSETETAQPATVTLYVALGQAVETETAQTVDVVAGGGTVAATRVAYGETTWAGTGATKLASSVSWQTGDRIVVLGMTGDAVNTTLGLPTVAGLTFAAKGTNPTGGASACGGYAWEATAGSNGSGQVQGTRTAGVDSWGLGVWVFRGSDGTGAKAAGASTAKTISMTRTGDASRVVEVIGDWSAGTITNHVWTPTGQTEDEASQDPGIYTVFAADWDDQGAAGTTSYGITGTASTGNHTKVAVEILGTAGAGGPTNVPLGQPAETETALPAVPSKRVALALDTETETARAVIVSRRFALGLPAETETAQPATAAKRVALGQAVETETAQGFTTAGPQQVALGQPAETETARAFTAAKRVALGISAETETAQPVTLTERVALALTAETETARPATLARRYPLAQLVETETARAVTTAKRVALGQALETESAQPISTSNVRIAALGQVAETESARTFTTLERVALGQALETEALLPVTVRRLVTLTRPSETETAAGLTYYRGIRLGQTVELESVAAVAVRELAPLGSGLEQESALGVVPVYPSGWRDVTVEFELEADRAVFRLEADRAGFELEADRARFTFEEDA